MTRMNAARIDGQSVMSVRLPLPLKRKLSDYADAQGMSENLIIRLALEDYLRTK